MKEIVVLSGKGGTGKTSLVACFAALAPKKVLADCDVDAANLHLLLHPEVKETNEFWSGQKAAIEKEKCTSCGTCRVVCRFGAVSEETPPTIDEFACEGCGFCARVCPAKAITMQDTLAGYWYLSATRYGPMVHARLGIAQENSGKLVTQVRKKARTVAAEGGYPYLITDGPPGIGCPVISTLSGADLALLVTEPTVAGLHDLERIYSLCRHFGLPALVCINKYDLNPEVAARIEGYCRAQELELAGKIAFDPAVAQALVQGVPLVEYTQNATANAVQELWQRVARRLAPA